MEPSAKAQKLSAPRSGAAAHWYQVHPDIAAPGDYGAYLATMGVVPPSQYMAFAQLRDAVFARMRDQLPIGRELYNAVLRVLETPAPSCETELAWRRLSPDAAGYLDSDCVEEFKRCARSEFPGRLGALRPIWLEAWARAQRGWPVGRELHERGLALLTS